MKVLAVYPISNSLGIELYEFNGEIALVATSNSGKADKPRVHQVNYSKAGRPYIRMMGGSVYLDEFMKV